ncbi:MAG: SDR family oxidoreductase [Geothrix sp.]|uniref:SDR family NAD(P)-dependent oxidoreductase n=1 Tax=Geothrix sp. TaxID=1962974 RepID=UPI0017DEE639|nr:SDR family NAD(P)-dependent oxidoreductase [Geothrix sp.]NWJ41749.1 SDR family oxidoreductase [Geothrix sp.]WIL20272.1 MAG: SDR family oxidoreductase [Geothrix sp.]
MTRRILITGASRGIGRACALWLAQTEAAHLVLLGRDAQALASSAEAVRQAGGTAEVHAADVADRSALATLAGSVGRLDGLVAAAGISGMTPVDRDSDAFFDEILATDLTGPWNTVRAFLPAMGAGGRIVLVSSVLGRFGVPGYGAYCAAKHGLIGLAKALALELIDRGIVVNAVAPGWVDTDMAQTGIRQIAAATGQTEAQFRAQAEAAVPVKRFFQPEEIAQGIGWLLNPANTMQVGQCLNLDGGVVQS